MTSEEIIDKAGEKAEKNGFVFLNTAKKSDMYFAVIFSHEFAKAFWGEEETIELTITQLEEIERTGKTKSYMDSMPEWKRQLQQMVLEEDPIKYLEKFL